MNSMFGIQLCWTIRWVVYDWNKCSVHVSDPHGKNLSSANIWNRKRLTDILLSIMNPCLHFEVYIKPNCCVWPLVSVLSLIVLSHSKAVALTDSGIIFPWQVNTNGFVSVADPQAQSEYLGKMPASFGMIAAFLGDLDTSDGVGKVYFRQDTSPELLQRTGEQISQAFPGESKIEPTHALVVTWENVGAQGAPERGDGSHKKASPFSMS